MNELSETDTKNLENLIRITVRCKACQLMFDYVVAKTGGTRPPKREYCRKPLCPGPKYQKHNARAKRAIPTRLAFGWNKEL